MSSCLFERQEGMTWKEQSRVDERMRLVGEYLKGERTVVAICEEYGVSSKTAYKWIGRYQQRGSSSSGCRQSYLVCGLQGRLQDW